MNKNEYGVIQLPSGLFVGMVGKNYCLVCRDNPNEALNDAREYAGRLKAIKIE